MKRAIFILVAGFLVAALITVGCVQKAPAPTTVPTTAPTGAPATTPTGAPTLASFEGKTITIVVPSAAGGSSDLNARMYAKFLAKYLPGNPTIIVRDMPGAEGTIGANYVSSQKPNGLTVLVGGGTLAMMDLLKSTALKMSYADMTAAVAYPSSTVYYVKPNLIDKPEDVVKAKGLIFGGTPGTSGTMFLLGCEVLGVPLQKVALGYEGAGPTRRAFISGETSASGDPVVAYNSEMKPYVDRGEAKVVFQSGMIDKDGNIVRHPGVPDHMTVKELYEKIYGKSPSGTAYEALTSIIASSASVNGPLLLAPRTPDNIVRAYWDAAEKMIKDPEFIAKAEALAGRGVVWMAGEGFNNVFHKVFGMKPEVVDWLRNFMRTKYNVVL